MNQGLKDRFEDILTDAKRWGTEALDHADGVPGNVSGTQREEVAMEYLTERLTADVEAKDEYLPTIGVYMDLPPVDFVERALVHLVVQAFVRKLYADREIKKLAASAA